MKSYYLLFGAIISVNFGLAGAGNRFLANQEANSKLQEYFLKIEDSGGRESFDIFVVLPLYGISLTKDGRIDCDKVKNLSDEKFKEIIHFIAEMVFIYFYGGLCDGEIFKKIIRDVNQNTFSVLQQIDQCRPLLPLYNQFALEVIAEASDEDYQRLEDDILQKERSDVLFEGLLVYLGVPFVDLHNEYILHPNNIEKLRALRAELKAKK